jgi:hypothetical protein
VTPSKRCRPSAKAILTTYQRRMCDACGSLTTDLRGVTICVLTFERLVEDDLYEEREGGVHRRVAAMAGADEAVLVGEVDEMVAAGPAVAVGARVCRFLRHVGWSQ